MSNTVQACKGVSKMRHTANLAIVPIHLKEANNFILNNHRHHKPKTNGYKFCVAVNNIDNNKIIGVAIVALPVSRFLCDGFTLEVSRTCTDGTLNANSMLYGACYRIAKEMGYKKLITYTLPSESGSSLKAVNWVCVGLKGGGTWNKPEYGRLRIDKSPIERKLRWEIIIK